MQINGQSTNANFLTGLTAQSTRASEKQAADNGVSKNAPDKNTELAQQRAIQELKSRDSEVRAHEQAHLAAAGGIAVSGARFSYVTGPDGQRYASGGDVSIDTSEVPGDPQATIRKAETIRRAALAPAQPSGQDYSVAGSAAAMVSKAALELLKSQQTDQRVGSRFNASA